MAEHRDDVFYGDSEDVPREVVQSILREHLGDESATLTSLDVRRLATSGDSGNNTHYRARIAWRSERTGSPGADEWIVKCWRPGGLTEALSGVREPLEALAWQCGLIRPQNLPAGVVAPFIGARTEADLSRAWIAMEDVSVELDRYGRTHPLPDDQLLARVKVVLERFARFHIWWEQPEQKQKLRECPWLVSLESMLWRHATTWAVALGREPVGPFRGGEVTDGTRVQVRAFLDLFPPADRSLWQELIVDRRPLIAALQDVPRTLLHGDTDDRNIGLRWAAGSEGGPLPENGAELVLIDWEWPCVGPAALDVALILERVSLLSDPSKPAPEFCRSDELTEYYFDCCVDLGAKRFADGEWLRALGLSRLVHLLTWAPWTVGSMALALQGLAPLPRFPGLPEEVMLQRMKSLWREVEHALDMATCAAQRWLG